MHENGFNRDTNLRHLPPPLGRLEDVLLALLELPPEEHDQLAVADEQGEVVAVLACGVKKSLVPIGTT